MKYGFFLLLLAISATFVQGQADLEWRSGSVVLADRQVLTGDISYHSPYDVILFRSSDDTVVIHARKIQQFRFHDAAAEINRQFITIKMENRQHHFFEVVVQGPIKVLRSEKIFSSPGEVEGYNYFTWDGTSLQSSRRFRSQVYPLLFGEYPGEIKSLVDRNNLNPSELKSAILIVREYNRIVQSQPVMVQVK